MISEAEGLPPLVDRRHYYDDDHVYAARGVRSSVRPAHGGYPTPRREIGYRENVVDGVYGVEHAEGYREKIVGVPARRPIRWDVTVTVEVGSMRPVRSRRWWDRLRWAW